MKKIQIAAFLALAGTGIFTQSARANTAGSFTYASGDVLIGFSSTSSSITTDYLLDVNDGIINTAPGTTVTLGNFGSDLSSFDPSFFTDGTTKWGVIGTQVPGNSNPTGTLYVGAAETSASPTPASGVDPSYYGRTLTLQNSTASHVGTVGTNFTNFTVDNSNDATQGDTGSYNYPVVGWQLQNSGAQGSPSWYGQANAITNLGFSQYSGFQGTLGSSSFGDSLDFYQITPSTSGQNTAVLEGVFNVDSSGVITYTQAAAVPEPSTLAALIGGAGFLALIRRRRTVMA